MMRKFLVWLDENVPAVWWLIAIALASILAMCVAHTAEAQTVCTYTEQNGAVRNCTGQVMLNQIKAVNNQSGTTSATANTSTQVLPANPSRLWLYVANPANATNPLYVNFGGPATATTIVLQPGGNVQFVAGVVPVLSVNIASPAASQAYIAMEGN